MYMFMPIGYITSSRFHLEEGAKGIGRAHFRFTIAIDTAMMGRVSPLPMLVVCAVLSGCPVALQPTHDLRRAGG
jgi:hypothetical protein